MVNRLTRQLEKSEVVVPCGMRSIVKRASARSRVRHCVLQGFQYEINIDHSVDGTMPIR